MKSNNILKLIMKNDLVIPNILLMNYKDLKISEKELIFLSYLMSYENMIVFDINTFKDHLNYSMEEIMNVLASLTDKKLVNMTVIKENDKSKEYIDISCLYNKLVSYTLLEEDNVVDDDEIYSVIEKEFGRCLSPIECETIKHWLDSGLDVGIIKEALKEAVLNGVNNLKYIDKILFEWTKKGYRKPQDIKKNTNKNNNESIDIFDYDWLDNE